MISDKRTTDLRHCQQNSTVHGRDGARETVCIHTRKVFDSCKDKDCIENLRLFPTLDSQRYIDGAASVRIRSADLLFVQTEVEEIAFNRGFYTIYLRYYYKIRGEAAMPGKKNHAITGFALFDKRVILFGSEGGAKIFTSGERIEKRLTPGNNLPIAVVEAVDPVVLSAKLVNLCDLPCCEKEIADVPLAVRRAFEGDLMMENNHRRVTMTLGQFSIVRLERDVTLLVPAYDYCIPEKICKGAENPCAIFDKIQFPTDEFFPPDAFGRCNDRR